MQQVNPHAKVGFEKVPISLQKNYNDAGAVLLDKGITVSIEVLMLFDYSRSMAGFYANGSVIHLGNQILGWAANVDGDGSVETVYYETKAHKPFKLDLNNFDGELEKRRPRSFGSTNMLDGLRTIHKTAMKIKSDNARVVVLQTDGVPDGGERGMQEVEDFFREKSGDPVHYVCVYFGSGTSTFLTKMDNLTGRRFDNVSTYNAGPDPKSVPNAVVYNGITKQLAPYIDDDGKQQVGWLREIGAM